MHEVLKLCFTVLICFINYTCLNIIPCASFIPVTNCSINLLQSEPPAPQGSYICMIMIIKMIEIYNIVPQPYYCWWTHAYCIKTITPHAPLTYFCLKRRHFVTSCVQPLCSSTNQQLFKKSTLFVVNKDKWDTKEGHGKSMKNALHAQQYASLAEAMSNSKKNQACCLSHCWVTPVWRHQAGRQEGRQAGSQSVRKFR